MRFLKGLQGKRNTSDIAPDEIFLDSSNLPDFDRSQFEGRIEQPIARRTTVLVIGFFVICTCVIGFRLFNLEVVRGAFFADRSESNSLHDTIVFSDRGVISDRNGTLLAWNAQNPTDPDFSLRQYATTSGVSNLLGYIKYPTKDSSGFYYREDYVGMDGVEKFFNDALQGENGTKITETNAFGAVETQSVLAPPKSGENLKLSIDSRVQSAMYNAITDIATRSGFTGGAGVLMDVRTGEVISEVTYPEYNSQVMSDGTNTPLIQNYLTDPSNRLLDRATSGLYIPGSIVKPVMALGALDSGVISPDKVLYTTGSISIQNPYNPSITYVYKDWKDQGPLDMRKAIEQSSDVYFYEVGGGYKDQKGMGIANIEKYTRMFGYGEPVNSAFFGTKAGTIPSPEWKEQNFNGEQWTIGDTYHTVIGQYGFQVTPLQVVRAISAVANDGILLSPTIIAGDTSHIKDAVHINLPKSYFDVVHDGMRRSAEQGTAVALNVDYVHFAGKTGTAQLGLHNESVNSWVTGFFPYEDPHYAFVIIMEKGKAGTLIGAPAASRELFDWMNTNTPEYFAL